MSSAISWLPDILVDERPDMYNESTAETYGLRRCLKPLTLEVSNEALTTGIYVSRVRFVFSSQEP